MARMPHSNVNKKFIGDRFLKSISKQQESNHIYLKKKKFLFFFFFFLQFFGKNIQASLTNFLILNCSHSMVKIHHQKKKMSHHHGPHLCWVGLGSNETGHHL